MSALWWLRERTFGVHHWYAMLISPTDCYDVQYVMTAEDARRETEWDHRYTYRAGQATTQFVTKDLAASASVTAWRALAKDGDALIRGNPMFGIPREALGGPEEFVVESKRLLQRYESYKRRAGATGPYTAFPNQMKNLEARWQRNVEPFGAYGNEYGVSEYATVRRDGDAWVFVTEEELRSIEREAYADEVVELEEPGRAQKRGRP